LPHLPRSDFWPEIFELADPKNKNVLLIDGSKEATVVQLEDQQPLGQQVPRQRIFVRECYTVIFDKIWKFYDQSQGPTTVTLTGTSGIGKSLFGLLFLIELIRFLRSCKASRGSLCGGIGLGLNGRIVYEHVRAVRSSATYYLIDTETKAINMQYEKPADWLYDENVFLVKDGPCDDYDVACQVLWVSSPRAGSFQKAGELGGNTLVMPPWTPDEIVACWTAGCAPANLFPMPISDKGHLARTAGEEALSMLDDTLSEHAKHEAVLRRWTADLGPVARRVFNPTDGYTKLHAALGSDLFKEDLCKLAEEATSHDAGGESNRFKTSHRLLLMIPSGDLTTYNFVPSSAKIARTILRKSLETDLKSAKSLLGKIAGANRGLVFEPYAHFMLSTGGTFTIRSLPADGENAESVELMLPSRMPTVDVDNKDLVALELRDGTYYQPTDPNFAVVDSWTTLEMFQITVGLSHPIKSNSKQFKALQGKGPTRIIFVVPKDIEDRFQRQQLVLADGKPSKGGCGPNGGWNDVQQFILSL
jgi:hypothetical protein